MIRSRLLPLVAVVSLALVAAACNDSLPETADPSTTSDGAETAGAEVVAPTTVAPGGYELVEPNPDPTPIEVSPDVRIGTLDNGLTYYVRSNQAPGSSLSLRLAVDAGSLLQDEPESGVAHFLEHMLFNGTERFPGNELARALERIGVQFGADLNAYTSFDETVYQLDLTSIDDDTIGTGFDVLADWASSATIDQQATVEERGVVREEIRLRDEGADGVISAAFIDAYLRGTDYEGHEPGGRSDLVLETDAEELRTFYERWYRPDLMAVIAVGDLPLDRLEAEVVERFAALEDRSDRTPRPEPIVDPIATPIAEVITHPELPQTFSSIDYSLTTWDPSTVGGERLTLIQEMFGLMINNRLQEAADRGDVELDQPFVTRFDETRVQSFLGFNFDAPDLASGTEYVLTEMQRLQLNGFTDAEYERARAEVQTLVDQFLSAAPTIQDRSLADGYVAHFLTGSQISTPAATHERLTTALEEITAAEVTDVLRWELSRAAPIVIVVGPDEASLPTVAQLDAAIEAAAAATPTVELADDGVAIESLLERPEPVEPVSSGELDDLVATEWVFANGATVRFIESDIATNQVDLLALADGGWSLLDPDDAAVAPFAVSAVANSGVGPYDRLTLRRFLAGTTSRLVPFIDETTEGFAGGSGVDDLEILFQQLHLAVTEPAVDELAVAEIVDDAEDQQRFVTTDAGFATLNALADARFAGDERFLLAPPALDGLTGDRALGIYRERLGTVDDLVIAIAGDVDAARIEELAMAYIGTLPGGAADTFANIRPAEVNEIIRRDVVAGSGDATGTVAVLYPSTLDLDGADRIELLLLEGIFSTRLLDVVREKLGASYGGSASIEARVAPTEAVDALLFANIDPARGEEILTVILAEAQDLATNGPTDDELDRARSVLRGNFDLVGNGDFIQMMLTDPGEEILTYDRRAQLLSEVELADITDLAARVLPSDARIEVVTTPG